MFLWVVFFPTLNEIHGREVWAVPFVILMDYISKSVIIKIIILG